MENESGTLSKIRRLIGHLNDPKEADEAARAATRRKNEIWKRIAAQKDVESWNRVRMLEPGTVLHCCVQETFIGGNFQRGDSMTVHSIQPRAKRLWVTKNGLHYWFNPSGITRYNLQLTPPEKPLSPDERAIAEDMAKRVAEALR